MTKRAAETKLCQPQQGASSNIAHAEDMAASHDMSTKHQVFTDLSMCAREEHLARYLLLRILPELAARMWRYIPLETQRLAFTNGVLR
jgi:hypothetical protein